MEGGGCRHPDSIAHRAPSASPIAGDAHPPRDLEHLLDGGAGGTGFLCRIVIGAAGRNASGHHG